MDTREVLAWLERRGARRNVEGLARYGIVAPRAFGVPVGTLLGLAKRLGKDHALAAELWESGWYEARLLAAMVDDPRQVTRRQMNAWAADFDSWAVCDTVCWHLFDWTPFAWEKARQWSTSPASSSSVLPSRRWPDRPDTTRPRPTRSSWPSFPSSRRAHATSAAS